MGSDGGCGNEGIGTKLSLTRGVMRNLNYHRANITNPTTARKAVKPTLTEVESAPLPLPPPPWEVLLGVTPVAVPDGEPDAPDGVTDEFELEALARARKLSKVLLPEPGALIAMTIPATQ